MYSNSLGPTAGPPMPQIVPAGMMPRRGSGKRGTGGGGTGHGRGRGGGSPAGSGGTAAAAAKHPNDIRGIFYPRRLTYTLAFLKMAAGCGLVLMGAMALYLKASYSRSAAGLWAGIIVIISGVLGAFTVKMNASRIYVLLFFTSCAVSLIADVLVIIYAATGLAKDSGFPGGFIRDEISGDLIPVSQVNIPAREKAMLANLLLIILGVLEVLFTLPSAIICLREVCLCYSDEVVMALNRAAYAATAEQIYEPRIPNDWLLSWLGQQQQPPPPPSRQPIYFSGTSGIPFATKVPPSYAGHPHLITPGGYVLLPSPEHSHSGGSHSRQQSPRDSNASGRTGQQQRRSRSPNPGRSSSAHRASGRMASSIPHRSHSQSHSHYAAPLEIYAPSPATHFYIAAAGSPHAMSYPSPGSNFSHPASVPLVPIHGAPPPWIFGGAGVEDYGDYYQQIRPPPPPQAFHYGRPRRSSRPRSAGRTASAAAAATTDPPGPKKRLAKRGPTDSDLDKTYTGLDRELAEEFIEQTMDPNALLDRKTAGSKSVGSSRVHSDGGAGGSSGSPPTAGGPGVNSSPFSRAGMPLSGTESEGAW